MLVFPVKGKIIDTTAARHKVVQSQAVLDTIRFDLPSSVDDVDLSSNSLTWTLVFVNSESAGDGAGLGRTVDDDGVHLLWTPSEEHTSVAGQLLIQLVATDGNGGRWLSAPARVMLLEALSPEGSPSSSDSFDEKVTKASELLASVVEYYQQVSSMKEGIEQSESNALDASDASIKASESAASSASVANDAKKLASQYADQAESAAEEATEANNNLDTIKIEVQDMKDAVEQDKSDVENLEESCKTSALNADKSASNAADSASSAQKSKEDIEAYVTTAKSSIDSSVESAGSSATSAKESADSASADKDEVAKMKETIESLQARIKAMSHYVYIDNNKAYVNEG